MGSLFADRHPLIRVYSVLITRYSLLGTHYSVLGTQYYNYPVCGIAGFLSFQSPELDQNVLEQMSAALCHRGPDAYGFHREGPISLISRRLKIIDLSPAASQPMRDETSRYHLIYNGEIYNFQQLREGLQRKYSFFSNSDTEVILRLFQEKGESSVSELNGMFAFAIWDSLKQELLLARDHAGVKPLYYYADDTSFVFASELAALFRSKVVRTSVDKESLSLYLQLGYFPASKTPYRHIKKLLPGCILKISAAGSTIHKYWNIRDFQKEKMEQGQAEASLEEALSRAVERQMISDVPFGAFLSGGLDSSLIVALMKRLSDVRTRTFTVGFSRLGYYDERPIAREVARLFDTEHHEFVVEKRIDEIVPELASVFGEPFADSSAIPTFCLAKLARKHVTVALSGTGGDEIFGGYRKYMAAHWTSIYTSLPSALRATIRKTVDLLPASRRTLWQERALLLQRFASLSPDHRSDLQLNLIFKPTEADTLLGNDGVRSASIEFEPTRETLIENMMLFDYEYYLPEDLLVKEDRCTMAFGLEARVPYLDRAVVELMAKLPVSFKVSRTATKKLLKKVASKYLPASIIQRPKHGFGAPVAEWLRTDLKELADQTLFSPRTSLKSTIIREKWEEHQKGLDHSRQLWTCLMLELWHERSYKWQS